MAPAHGNAPFAFRFRRLEYRLDPVSLGELIEPVPLTAQLRAVRIVRQLSPARHISGDVFQSQQCLNLIEPALVQEVGSDAAISPRTR